MSQDSGMPAHRIVPSRAERVTPDEATDRKPGAFHDTVPADRLGGIVRASGQKAASGRQLRRDEQFVAANQLKHRSGGPRGG